jgi:two-component system, NtrC family, response regulator AtoC
MTLGGKEMDKNDNELPSIAVVDDEPVIRRTVAEFLRDQEYPVRTFESGRDLIESFANEAADIVISDIKMPGMDGFELLRYLCENHPTTEVVLITAYGDMKNAVRALREGAFDFFTKPIKLSELMMSIERTRRFHQLRREKDHYRNQLQKLSRDTENQYSIDRIIGSSGAINQVKKLITTLQDTDATTVLVVGESGTGKELVARAIHHGSRRSLGPFVSVNCTAIPETLIESELYGHEKGAFTDAKERRKGQFELADGGTLFLDEIGDMSLTAQAKVLRTIEEREVRRVGGTKRIAINTRIVSATNKNLPQAISESSFREDLYYRLNTFVVYIPPLRRRPDDIRTLCEHFLHHYAVEMRKEVRGFAAEVLDYLIAQPFPGNVRELKNVIERAVIMCKGTCIEREDLLLQNPFPEARREIDGNLDLHEMEQKMIEEAMERVEGNQVRAAALLGISRDALRRRLQSYGLLGSVLKED